MATVAAPAEAAPGGAPGAPALLSVRALPKNATQAERNKAKKTWPPVENGGRFVLFVDDLRLDEYTTPRCDVRMAVHHDGSISCDEPNCENPPFGASTYTRAAASAAKHLRAYHLKKLVRSAIVDTDAKKKRKTNMNAAEKIADPSRTVDDGAHTLGFKVLPRADVAEARKKEHEAAQSARQEMEDKAKMRRETIAAAAMDAAAASAADAAKLTAAETAASEMVSAAGQGQFERVLSRCLAGALFDERGMLLTTYETFGRPERIARCSAKLDHCDTDGSPPPRLHRHQPRMRRSRAIHQACSFSARGDALLDLERKHGRRDTCTRLRAVA